MEAAEALAILQAWAESGNAVALHILGCEQCNDDRQQYCAECDRLWAIEMNNESKVIGVLPKLQQAGVDVKSAVGRFKFMAKSL